MTAFFQGFLAQGTGDKTGFVENTGTGYARQAITTTALANGSCYLSAQVLYTAQQQVIVTQRALYDAPTGGNLIMWWNLSTALTVTVGSSDILKTGVLSHTFPDLFNGMGSGTAVVEYLAGRKIGTTADGNSIFAGTFLKVTGGAVAAATSV